jgi:hypothetical protein
MAQGHRRKIEIFTAGCATCNETVELVKRLRARATTSKFTTCIRLTLQFGQSSTEFEACRVWSSTASLRVAAPDGDRTRPF